MSPNDALAQLKHMQFTTHQLLKAALVTSYDVQNAAHKSDLLLSSESGGQGRTRLWRLIDVYQIGVYRILARLSGNAAWAAAATNEVLLSDWLDEQAEERQPIELEAATKSYRRSLCMDIGRAPLWYQHRDLDNPFCVFADFWQISAENAQCRPELFADIDLHDARRLGGIFVNLTGQLIRIDASLIDQVNPPADA